MGITGKYDFAGIKKFGAKGIELLLSSTFTWFAAALKIPVIGTIIDHAIQSLVNWMANNGLVVLNVIGNDIGGSIDQSNFDDAMDKALASVGVNRESLTLEQKKKIDNSVIAAFRKFAPL